MIRVASLALVVALAGCTRAVASAPPPAADATSWLCRPDRADDPCVTADLSVTELRPDGSRAVRARLPVASPDVDCFYVYPTVDLELVPGNHADLADTRRMRAVTLAQAGGLRQTCALWVPLYRQVTIGTYLQPRPVLEEGLARGFADVERAFREYLAATSTSRRRIVLVGHSQGGEMVIRLVRRFFERDPALRQRLLLAMAIGAEVEVPLGRTTGATFENVPVCTRPLETGCVVAYRTHAAGDRVDPDRWAPANGNETACVDPARLDGPSDRLADAVFPTRDPWGGALRPNEDLKTPFVSLPRFFSASCVRGERNYVYLAASSDPPPGDARTSPVDFAHRRFRIAKLGLHVLDLQLPQGDLIDLVARRIPAR